jgi:S1-C subfamily serine protease
MQGLEELVDRVKSSVVHLIIHKGKERLGSGTGFFVSQKLVTTSQIIREIPTDVRLAVRFHDTPPAHADHSFSSEQVQQAICAASDARDNDYAILDLPDLLQHNPHQFRFAAHEPKIGQSVALIGYPLEHWCLTCHSGIVSAIYPRGHATMLQLDATVDPSNVGGPLFDQNGDVLGIVTRGATALTDAVDNLLKSFDDAISVLSGTNFFAATSRAMISIQQDMKEVARQVQRSSSGGIGFAVACDKIRNESLWSDGT